MNLRSVIKVWVSGKTCALWLEFNILFLFVELRVRLSFPYPLQIPFLPSDVLFGSGWVC